MSYQEVRCWRLCVAAKTSLDAPLGFCSSQVALRRSRCRFGLRGVLCVLRAPKSPLQCRASRGPRRGHRLVRPGPSRSVAAGAPKSSNGLPSALLGLRRAPVVLRVAPMPPNPVGSGWPLLRREVVCRAPVRLPFPPKRVGSSNPGGTLRSILPRKGGLGGLGGSAAGGVIPPKRAGGAGASLGPRPRRGLGSLKLPLGPRAFWGKPQIVRFSAGHRPSEEGRALCIAGDSSHLEKHPGCRAEA